MTDREPDDKTTNTSRDQYAAYLRAIGNFFHEHPAIVGSLLYLQITIVGVVYSWSLFRLFNINIFDYAETNDFLLAAFKDPIVFGMSITTLVLGIGFGLYFAVRQPRLNVRVRGAIRQGSVSARIGITFGPTVMILSIVVGFIYTIGIPFFFASSKADTLLSGQSDEPLTSVKYRATSKTEKQTTETGLRVIGTTQSFVFFYDRSDTRTLVIPTAQIVEMKHDGPKSEPKEKQK